MPEAGVAGYIAGWQPSSVRSTVKTPPSFESMPNWTGDSPMPGCASAQPGTCVPRVLASSRVRRIPTVSRRPSTA
jgi:hypothetical protein